MQFDATDRHGLRDGVLPGAGASGGVDVSRYVLIRTMWDLGG